MHAQVYQQQTICPYCGDMPYYCVDVNITSWCTKKSKHFLAEVLKWGSMRPAKPHSLSISYLIRTSCISSRTSNNNVYSIDILLYENCHRAILPLDYSLAQCKNGNFVLLHTGSPALEELRSVWVRQTHSVAPFTLAPFTWIGLETTLVCKCKQSRIHFI